MLDAAVAVGAVPSRFARFLDADGGVDLAAYFTIARGVGDDAPLEMTKWFDSNYHYLVPEIGPDTEFSLHADRILGEFAEAKAQGFLTRPVIVGPVTFLLLAKPGDGAPAGFRPLDRLADLVPVYAQLLEQLDAAGAEWVQLDEPALVSESLDEPRDRVLDAAAATYDTLGASDARPSIFVAAPYGALDDALGVLAATPVEAIGLDLVRGTLPAQLDPATEESLATKTLVAGVIDGHNIWRGDVAAAFARAEAVQHLSGAVAVSTSTSLLHVPHDVDDETALDARLVSWLAFADQKVAQVATLARGLTEGREAIETDLAEASAALADRGGAPGVRVPAVRDRLGALDERDFARPAYDERVAAQSSLALPATADDDHRLVPADRRHQTGTCASREGRTRR